jgi:ribosome-associated toxin RatA of RatAB toxin-antitoxin module
MMKRILTPLLLTWLLAWLPAWPLAARAGTPAFTLTVTRVDDAADGKVYRIASSATVAAAPAAVWRVLTDYDHLADFVPDLTSARVLSREGDKVIVEQLGAAHFLFFSHAIHLVTQVHEQAPDRIEVGLIEGDMRVYRCSWALSPAPGAGTNIVYTATIAPGFYVPGMIGERLVRDDIARMMAAVLARTARAP